MSSANFGLQLGMQDVQVMLFVMTDQGVQSLLDSQMKLSADVGTSFASSGSGLEAGTAGEHNTPLVAPKCGSTVRPTAPITTRL